MELVGTALRLFRPSWDEKTLATGRITDAFNKLAANGQMAFMPFVTAGDPDLQATTDTIRELAAAGVDLIELGFPYSDPIADGPVIQASYTRALNRGIKVSEILGAVARLHAEGIDLPPIVGMVSYAIVFRTGPQRFAKQAVEAGFSGLIIPDLPGDEAEEMAVVAKESGLDLIQLVAPTTPADRAERIVKTCSGFLYCVAVAGTTGVRDGLPDELTDQLKSLREKTDLPFAVGFGISQPDHVEVLRGVAQGVIVGSAIVKRMQNEDSAAAIKDIGEFARSMVKATHSS
jgi:tryptophan synthase alpha chain